MRKYDILIAGSSLASRIAGALLAKGGARVLTLDEPLHHPSPWLHPCAHLERILERLGSPPPSSPAVPFQVLTRESRLDFHGPVPLAEELRREFPGEAHLAEKLLLNLQGIGNRLENAIWESGGLPLLGPGSSLRFARKRLRTGLFGSALRRPLSEAATALGGGPLLEAISALFSGLAATPFDELSVAEGAILWSGACRPQSLPPDRLEETLANRYRQFRGSTEALSSLEKLQGGPKGGFGITLKGGAECSADHLLLGSPAALPLLGGGAPDPLHPPPPLGRFTATLLDGKPSALLASRVILGGDTVVRLGFATKESRTTCAIDCVASREKQPSVESVRRRLETVLPFCELSLEEEPYERLGDLGHGKPRSGRRPAFPGALNPLRLSEKLLLCNGAAVLPSLGTTGEILVGLTVVNHLLGDGADKGGGR